MKPSSFKLRYQNLTFAYRRSPKHALEDINFDLNADEFIALVGATGAGKSTFVRCASGIVPKFFKGPYAGTVLLEGKSIADKRVADLAGKVGTLFQDFESQLFSTNVRLECAFGMENLGVARNTMRERIDRIARLTGISGLMDREPQSLSGGQKQRLALASVLCLNPEILLCDEPTTDLDPMGRKDLFAVLHRLRDQGHSIVLVEHETDRLLNADRVVVLQNGHIIHDGPPLTVFGDVGFCANNGLCVPQLFELCAKLDIRERPCSIVDALFILKQCGFRAANRKTVSASLNSSGDFPCVATGQQDYTRSFSDNSPPLLTTDNLYFSFTAESPVIKGVSFDIQPGEFVAILGSNGSGKTTLIKNMIGLLRPQLGHVLFRGEPVERIGISAMAKKVGMVFQNPDHMLFAPTVFEEIAFGLRNHGYSSELIPQRMQKVLAAVGLNAQETRDPFVMTKGDRQKLAVACVLACEPEVLILDEPTTGLDYTEQLKMMDLLQKLNATGHTIIIVTHSMEVAARYANRTIVMESGQVLADSSTRDIFNRPDLLSRASLEAPVCTQLGWHFGITALNVDELVAGLRRRR